MKIHFILKCAGTSVVSTIHLHPFITPMSKHLLIPGSKITGVPHDNTSVFVWPLIPWHYAHHDSVHRRSRLTTVIKKRFWNMKRERMCSTVLLHRLEEGAEGELSAPAVSAAESGSFSDLSFPVPLRSLFILNKRSINKQQRRNVLLVQGERIRFLTPSGAPCWSSAELHSFMICGRVEKLNQVFLII